MISNNKQYLQAKEENTLSTLNNRAKGLAPINLTNSKRGCLLIDTETIGDITKGEKAYPYDISFIEYEKGCIFTEKCFVNSNIFDNKYQMENAFYKSKIPFYRKALATNKKYEKREDKDILKELNKFIKNNSITYFMGYNVKFDYNSINNLYELNKEIKNLFKNLYLVDIWKVATDIIANDIELYESFMLYCWKNELYTESGLNVSTNADTMAKFVNNNMNFQECHTGLEDTYCELDILQKMLWYYKKTTGLDYYYKLDSVFNGSKKVFKNGVFNVDRLPYILEKHNIKDLFK